MRALIAYTAIALLSLLTLPARAGDLEPSPSLVSWIETQMSEWWIPGVSVAVIKDYHTEWAAGIGLRDKANKLKVSGATLFQAASVSKPVSAIATMIALDAHQLTIDEEVNTIFARFPPAVDVGAWTLPNHYPTPVTLRMLLSHTGGTNDFRYSGYRYGYYDNPPARIENIPTMHEELNGLPPANTPAIEVIRQPGLTWVYSPAGYTIIQAALMNLYGKPFADIMESLVLEPLGMTESTFAQPTPSDLTPRIAVPYLPDGQPLRDGPRVFDTAASGGLTTTPTDLAKLVIAFQNALAGTKQGRLTPEIARAMMERQAGEMRGKCFPSSDPNKVACQSSWGLGFDLNLTKYSEHQPDGEPTGVYFGHGGFNSGYLTVLLGSKRGGNGVVIMVNVAPEDMSTGAVPQVEFLTKLVHRIADEEQWQ
jgi:CubicO group peptidase (beta-lactamase class C family)